MLPDSMARHVTNLAKLPTFFSSKWNQHPEKNRQVYSFRIIEYCFIICYKMNYMSQPSILNESVMLRREFTSGQVAGFFKIVYLYC
ncbi:MAG: hypothetical protein PHH93_07390 [Prolixibacteraceae bacterium]|nr:hypothetical protein [Prolixibacteraceae bacterium]